MSGIANPHDKFFKEVFSHPEVVKDFLLHYLPLPIREKLDADTIVPLKDSFIDHALQEQFSDLLFSAQLKTHQDLYIYLLFEHKSHPESLISFHLLRYMVKIWENDLKEGNKRIFRWILPLVVYHGREKWNVKDYFSSLFNPDETLHPYIPDFRYDLYDLSQYEDDDIQGILHLRIALMLMKYIFRRDLQEKLGKIFRWMRELSRVQSIQDFWETVIIYLLSNADQMTYEDMRSEVEKAFSDKGESTMPTIAEQLIEKGKQVGRQEGWQVGKQEGRQEGWQEGRQEGKLECIQHILKTRFGEISAEILIILKQIHDPQRLDNLTAAAVSVHSPAEFIRILKSD